MTAVPALLRASMGVCLLPIALAIASADAGAQPLPGAPGNLAATVTGNQVRLTWTAPASGGPVGGYTIVGRLTPGSGIIALVQVGAVLSTTVSAPNGSFFVTVRAFNLQGTGAESNGQTIAVPANVLAPGAPQNLTHGVSGSTVSFAWAAPASGGTPAGYSLVASLTPGGAPLAIVPVGNALSYSASAVPAGQYYVRVVASNGGGTSAPSNEVAVVVAGPQVSGAPVLHAAQISGSTVTLLWTPTGAAATSYTVIAASTATGSPLAVISTAAPSLTATNVPNGTYYVQVTATNAAGTSTRSNQISFSVPNAAGMTVTVSGVNTQTIGGTQVTSSTRLGVSWSAPATGTVDRYEVVATESGATSSTTTTVRGATSTTLADLKANTRYSVFVRACFNSTCTQSTSSAAATGSTDKEYWQLQGTGNTVAGVTQVVPDGNARLSATRFGSDAGAVAGRIQLYYGPMAGPPPRIAAGVAAQAATESNPASYLSFESRSGTSGLLAPGSPATLIQSLATAQGVPLGATMGSKVRLFFEAAGADGRTRILFLDSHDGFVGQDFNASPASAICSSAADYSSGGGCAPTVAIGLESDAIEPNSRITNARQFKLGWPILESTHWDGAAGTYMVFTVDSIPGCSAFPINHGYAVWTGTRWNVQYQTNGCPKLFTSAQAAFPMHLGGVRYKMYYGDPSISTGRLTGSNLPFLGPKKLIYGDGQATGGTNLVDFEDWEAQSAARDVVFVWPTGEQLDAGAEGYIDDFHFLAPTGNMQLQVMYLTITDGRIIPKSGAAILKNP